MYYVVRVPGGPNSPHDRWLDTYEVRSSTGQVVNWSRDKEEMKSLAAELNQQAEAESSASPSSPSFESSMSLPSPPSPPSFYNNLETATRSVANSPTTRAAIVSSSSAAPSPTVTGPHPLRYHFGSHSNHSSGSSGSSSKPDYATQIMDDAVSGGLRHLRWLRQQQESLLDYFKQRIDNPAGDVGNLMEAGTAEIMRAQKNAMHTVTSSLAARGLLGSSAAESAYAKIAGETASKVGVLAADIQSQLLQTQTAREASYIQAMAQLLSIPTLQGYSELAAAGANASLFAVPTGGF